MTSEQKKQRSEIYRSLVGCKCPRHIDGKALTASERCSKMVIRCNERLATVYRNLDAAGLPR